MRLKIFVLLSIAALLCTPAMAGTRIDDPAKFVASIYATTVDKKPEPEDIYTPRLAALFALDRKEAGGEVGRMDFDFWSNAQDSQLSDVKVRAVPLENANREVVIATFRNLGKKQEIHFYFEKTTEGWKLDDARSLAGESWTLSLILKYGWDGKP